MMNAIVSGLMVRIGISHSKKTKAQMYETQKKNLSAMIKRNGCIVWRLKTKPIHGLRFVLWTKKNNNTYNNRLAVGSSQWENPLTLGISCFFPSVCSPNRLTYLHIHFIIMIGFEPLLSPNAGFHFLHRLLRLNVATEENADERRMFCHFDYIFFLLSI